MFVAEESPVKLVLAIVLPLIILVILAVVGLFVYKKWQKRTNHGYTTAETENNMELHEALAVGFLSSSDWLTYRR